jgi:hypothetical protein
MFTFLRSRNLTFDEDALKVLTEAFDLAWEKYRTSPTAPQPEPAARDVLAQTILSLAENFPADPKGLAKRALQHVGDARRS